MCKGWILDPVRTTPIKIEPERLFSSYNPQRGKYRTVHCTKHICTPGWPGGRFSLGRYDGGNHVLLCVSLRVSAHILLASIPCLTTASVM